MLREELVFVGTCDIAGHVRGKGLPASSLDSRRRKGVGWTHSNLMQTAFGPILDTPFGTAGDLMIVPDPTAEVRVDFEDGPEGTDVTCVASQKFVSSTATRLGIVSPAVTLSLNSYFMARKTPRRLVLLTRSHSSALYSCSGFSMVMPALLKATSSRP